MNNPTNLRINQRTLCTFVPPYVLENLARAGIEDATLTIHQTRMDLQERKSQGPNIQTLLGATPKGSAARQVFDSQNQANYQVKMVRSEGGPVVEDDAINNAYDFIGNFLDYLHNKINRFSLDNNGMDIICNVHYGVKYNNAFFDGQQINIGDGDGVIFTDFSKSLAVIAHELGHGIVQWTANFEYHDQPGALNEHYADVFGSAITQYIEKQTAEDADWLIGAEIMGPELYGEALRSMAAPGTAFSNSLLKKDPQPDHMKDYYGGTDDNGGVHVNSGIMNKAFYLTARELETENAALIWYTALQNLWPTANFNDAVAQIVKATQLLIKNKKIKSGSTQKVRAAFKEVGLPVKDDSRLQGSPTQGSPTAQLQLRQI